MSANTPAKVTNAERENLAAFAAGTTQDAKAQASARAAARKLIEWDRWLWAELSESARRNGELSASLRGTEQACAELRRKVA